MQLHYVGLIAKCIVDGDKQKGALESRDAGNTSLVRQYPWREKESYCFRLRTFFMSDFQHLQFCISFQSLDSSWPDDVPK